MPRSTNIGFSNIGDLPQKMAQSSIVLIDPKPLTRQAVVEMLSRAFPTYVTIAISCCGDLPEMEKTPHLVIVYVRSASIMESWWHNELKLVGRRLPNVPVAVISDREEVGEVLDALNAGVRGYIPSSVAPEVVFAALKLIRAGGTFIPEFALRLARHPPSELTGARNGLPDGMLALTPRELSVTHLLREGKPNKVIALELHMEESTVKVHVRNILKKLHSTNRTQAASVANRLIARQP